MQDQRKNIEAADLNRKNILAKYQKGVEKQKEERRRLDIIEKKLLVAKERGLKRALDNLLCKPLAQKNRDTIEFYSILKTY